MLLHAITVKLILRLVLDGKTLTYLKYFSKMTFLMICYNIATCT